MSPNMVRHTSSWGDLHTCYINSISRKTNKLQPGHELIIEKAIIWPWGHRSPTMVRVKLSWGDLPACLISKAYLIRQKSYNPNTKLSLKKTIIWPWGQSSRSKVTNDVMRHIVLMWSTHMPNIKSLSHETKKLQPGQDLLWMEARMDGQTDHYRAAATKRRGPKYFQIMIYIGMLNTLQQLIKGKQPILTDKH
jgi:hypothetical protein